MFELTKSLDWNCVQAVLSQCEIVFVDAVRFLRNDTFSRLLDLQTFNLFVLLVQKMETAKLSDFQKKIANGEAPMPLLTCLHVRPDTSAMTFHGKCGN